MFPVRQISIALMTLLATEFAWGQSSGPTDLSTLGGVSSIANAVSSDGSVVVGYSDTTTAIRAFSWSSGTLIDLGTLGGSNSYAYSVSADGGVIVGDSYTTGDTAIHAFRLAGGTMSDLGTLGGAFSFARGVSGDGNVVVGMADTPIATHAFKWVSGTMTDLGTLGGTNSEAYGTSGDGGVVVGDSNITGDTANHAFLWIGGVMNDLGTLGGNNSYATGISADGSAVVGRADTATDTRAFRWTAAGGMVDLGTLGGPGSVATGVSANGAVVVGYSDTLTVTRAFRWTQSEGMQSVEDWLRTNGVSVPSNITATAQATNTDGSVVVGQLANGHAFIARVDPAGSGIVDSADLQSSLNAAGTAVSLSLTLASTLVDGAHGTPLTHLVDVGRNVFWLAGDWGQDSHNAYNSDLGLNEFGIGRNFGSLQMNVSLGQTWGKKDMVFNGEAKNEGTYLYLEALVPVSDGLWATFDGYGEWGSASLRRGYLNATLPDYSYANPNMDIWGMRARMDWNNFTKLGSGYATPYIDLAHSETKLDAYTETGGGFPARFDARKDKSTQLRLGVNADWPLAGAMRFLATLEANHEFETNTAKTTGQVIDLFNFSIAGVLIPAEF
jgi:probable HAF family extracellular repeat protein